MQEKEDHRYDAAYRWPSVKAVGMASQSIDNLHALLEAEKEYNRSLPCDENLRSFFDGLSTHELLGFVDLLRKRLKNETDLLDRFMKMGLDPFAPDLLDAPLPYPVRLIDDTLGDCHAAGQVRAYFKDGVIHLAGEPPSLAERLSMLACRGIIGNDLFHEVIHGLQDDGQMYHSLDQVLEAVSEVERDEPRVALAEAHAWLWCLPGFRHEVLIDVIGTSYNIAEKEHLRSAFEHLYALVVLGLDDEEIGQLVGRAEWCRRSKSYLGLGRERERLMEANGLSQAELELEMQRRQLIERIQAVRAVGIAREMVEAGNLSGSADGEVVTL